MNPIKYFFSNKLYTPAIAKGAYPIASALVLCPTPNIIIRYVEKAKAKAPITANFFSTLSEIKRM